MERTTIPDDEIASLIINLEAISERFTLLINLITAVERHAHVIFLSVLDMLVVDEVGIRNNHEPSLIRPVLAEANQALVTP